MQLLTESAVVELSGYDYCWEGAGCADWFGSEVPTPFKVDVAVVEVRWVSNGNLTASLRDHHVSGCPSRLPLVPTEAGQGVMALPEVPGTYRIDFHGESPEGSSAFATSITSSVSGDLGCR
ncbi:MAG: hypothetical protein QNJ75_04450 [Acidimicrobiia bacterium]|nr:hypothetical protein [Acidimicrobiia bacterium]